MSFYVYALLDPRTNKPVYVGKGIGSRAWYHNKTGIKHKNIKLRLIYTQLRGDAEYKDYKFTVADDKLLRELQVMTQPINWKSLHPIHKLALLPPSCPRLIRSRLITIKYNLNTYAPETITVDEDRAAKYSQTNLIIKILANELTEDDALHHEQEYIAYYRKELGLDWLDLANENNGGGGKKSKIA